MKTLQTKISELSFTRNLKGKVLLFLLPFFIMNAFSQTKERKWNLGVLGGFSAYSGSAGSDVTNFTFAPIRQNPTIGMTISYYLNRSFDLTMMGTLGSWGYYPDNITVFKGTLLHGNLNFKYKFNNGDLIAEDGKLAPYLFAGMGSIHLTGKYINNGFDYPVVGGLGISLKLSEILSANYQATFGYMTMEKPHYNPLQLPPVMPTGNDLFVMHTLGFNFNLGAGKDEDQDGISDKTDKCAATPAGVKVDANGCPFDTDGDGVLDFEDKCINQVGHTSTKGCPDIDKDGIADMDDACPNEAGNAAYNGCPDTDGDGIIDSKDKCPNVKGTLTMEGCPDRDGDGIKDETDYCPDIAGIALFKGCPDTDNDGIEDSKDMCPSLKGPATTNGCPDTDNDGVNDGIDKCPAVAGSPAHFGCPDTDGDGVFDNIDRCIAIPGAASNGGCPELKKETKQLFQKALQGIQFESGKAIIKPVSFVILNAIVKVMIENATYKLLIGGYTDNVGDDAMNMTLSQDRASAVANYLISHGVDPMRVSATGYGESMPVDTNDSVKGRTRNRRVEFKVEFMQ